MIRKMTNKKGWLFAIALGMGQMMLAQGGANAIADAADEVGTYVPQVIQLMYAIGGIVGLVGGIRVYIKWNNGDQDVQKAVIGWLGACIFLIASATVVQGFFG